jgi:hypothetical protein
MILLIILLLLCVLLTYIGLKNCDNFYFGRLYAFLAVIGGAGAYAILLYLIWGVFGCQEFIQ